MKIFNCIILIYFTLIVSACGGGSSGDSLPEIYEVKDVNVAASSSNIVRGQLTDSQGNTEGFVFSIVRAPGNGELILNQDGSYVYTPKSGANGVDEFTYRLQNGEGQSNIGVVRIEITIVSACLSTRETLLSTEFLVNTNQSAVLTTLGEKQEVSGFVVEQSAYTSNSNARTMLLQIISRISGEVSSINTISEQKALSTVDSFSGQYRLVNSVFGTEITPTELSNSFYRNITDNFTDELPAAKNTSVFGNEFRLWVTVIYNSDDSVLIVLALVPIEKFDDFSAILDAYADGGNIALCGSEIASNTDQYIAEENSNNLADFLFVVDNSGSMGDEQQAVQEAANLFSNTIDNASLDYQIGVITTDNDRLRGTGFTSDIEDFKTNVVAGTGGSFTETGIYYAEQSLRSINEGDGANGTVTQAGYPRTDASLSVIILSDEPSQYRDRARSNFDVDSNLFIDRGYRVYSIVEETHANRSQYDDLAFSTGGAIASISDIESFPAIMEQIATNSGGAASRYILTGNPVSSTIKVSVNGSQVIRSRDDGWRYIALSNSIVFYGDAIPEAGEEILIEYTTLIIAEAEATEEN